MSAPDPKRTPAAAPRAADVADDLRRSVTHFVQLVLLFLLVVGVCRTFVLQSTPVSGPSMAPTLNDGERVLVWKLPAVLSRAPIIGGFDPVRPGHLIVFSLPQEANKRYIKRVVAGGPRVRGGGAAASAAPGVTPVQFERGALFVNNVRVNEPYLLDEERSAPESVRCELAPGQYYVLGDHRSVSNDSRRFGPIERPQILGRAVLRFWPLDKLGFL